MIARAMIILGTTMLVPAAAYAASMTVIGTNALARACYEAAESTEQQQPGPQALAVCSRALAHENLDHADEIATRVNRGIVHFRLNDFASALADFDHVLAIHPNQPDALINKGMTLLANGGEVESAMRLFNAGLAGTPRRPWVGYYGRAVAHELSGRDAAAYRDYKQAEQLKPGWTPASMALARFSTG